MRRLRSVLVVAGLVAASVSVVGPAVAANTIPTNPIGIAYDSTANVVAQYGHPGGMVVTGHCNRYAPEFAAARANGAEVLAYLNVMQRNDRTVCGADDDFYGGPPGSTPLWPYPTYGERVNFPETHMLDLRVGSAWVNRAVAYIENLMVEDKVDGVFLDVLGARLWGLSDWTSWPEWEQQAWTGGAVDLVRRLDASRRALNPRFIIINNNVWDGAGTAGKTAEQYVDGICLEHSTMDDYHKKVAGNAYSNLGHRRVIAVGHDTAEAQAWADVQGVTHVSNQTDYGSVTPPPVGFHRLTDRPKTFGRTTIGTKPPVGMGANQKRGSKFTLPDRATLLSFSAYLDGLGATSGSQSVRMVLYRDSAGVPVTRVAQSTNVVTINAGDQPRWVTFTAPATALDPGEYWISIHTGDTEGVARNRGDGAANWYSSIDPFSDGPSNPFGNGWTGTITLSVNATYTMGY